MTRISRTALALVFSLCAVGAAVAEDTTPYQKLVGSTFVKDMDKQPVTVRVVYDGMAGSGMTTIYKNSKINIKDKLFLTHHDPAGQAGQPAIAGAEVQSPFALSLPKASADAVLALTPGTVIEVKGTAHKSVFGMMAVKTEGLYVEGETMSVVTP